MSHILTAPKNLTNAPSKTSLWKRYLNFCDSQSNNRFLWFTLALMSVACIIMPISMNLIQSTTLFSYLVISYTAMLMANLVANLAELPTRISISLFFLTILFNILTPIVVVLLS